MNFENSNANGLQASRVQKHFGITIQIDSQFQSSDLGLSDTSKDLFNFHVLSLLINPIALWNVNHEYIKIYHNNRNNNNNHNYDSVEEMFDSYKHSERTCSIVLCSVITKYRYTLYYIDVIENKQISMNMIS